ncbi:ATP-binding protein [uncultured Aliiroseovarius sp.]|uniref:sensor histidine kinase n=1 Tax=uncultured Aliiroseovarius sp. TaxID=1658783 RepID=UPI002591DD07|nr:ATP-binding protein [uncultured Aliiroseovarius sp.]
MNWLVKLLSLRGFTLLVDGRDSGKKLQKIRSQRQLKDFVQFGMKLFWRRQAMYVGVAILTAYYFDFLLASLCYMLVLVSEVVDLYISRKVVVWKGDGIRETRRFLALVISSQIFNALAIASFAIILSWSEGPALHFTPLFLLFSAALFAAVNNHQIPQLLLIKLVIYGLAFIFIPLRDLIVLRPPIDSYLWLQFITVGFVLYFIIDCSLIFIKLYKKNMRQFESLKLERDRAMKASEAKSQFLSTVSHELRTPLTSINGSLALMRSSTQKEFPSELSPLLDMAQRNTDRLLLLIGELLDVQKMEADKMRLELEAVNLGEIVREAIETIEHYAHSSGIEIAFVTNAENLMIYGDNSRLLQVMANILSNAIKFSSEGDTVRVSTERKGDKAIVRVSDHGIGIPEEARNRLFQPFSQLDASDTRKFGGTGLGLHITKKILDRHLAKIDFESVVGTGTVFSIEFDLLPD